MRADSEVARIEAARSAGLGEDEAKRAFKRFIHRDGSGLRPRSSFEDFLGAYVAGLRAARSASPHGASGHLVSVPDAWRVVLQTLDVAPEDMHRVVSAFRARGEAGQRARASFSDFAGPYLLGLSDAHLGGDRHVRDGATCAAEHLEAEEDHDAAAEPALASHWRDLLTSEYAAWNEAIARELIGKHMSGRPVYLSLDAEQLEEIASRHGWRVETAERDFIEAVRPVFDPHLPPVRYPLKRPDVAARSLSLPPFIAVLALTVLAASRMTSDERYSSSNYYGRLAELLPGGVDPHAKLLQAIEGWKALNHWLEHTYRGQLGRATARPIESFTRIGYPLSQCILRERDRRQLPAFYRWAGFVPGDTAAPNELAPLLLRWEKGSSCTFSKHGRRAIREPSTRPLLAELVAGELAAWSGDVESAVNTRVRTAPVWLGLEFRRGGRVALLAIPQRPAGFPDHIDVVRAGTPLTLQTAEPEAPWYQPLSLTDPSADETWAAGGSFAFRFKSVRVAALTFDDDLNCHRQVGRLSFDEEAVVLAAPSHSSSVRSLLREFARPDFRESRPAGLPDGWLAFSDVRIRAPAPIHDPDLACLIPQASVGASLQEGLRLEDRSWLFEGGEPTVFVRNAIAEAPLPLAVDGQVVTTLPAEGGSFSLRELGLGPGDHVVEVGGRTLHFTTREGADPPGPRHPCRPLTIPLVWDGNSYAPASGEDFNSAAVGPGIVRVRGAEVIGLSQDSSSGSCDPVRLEPCGNHFIVLGQHPGDVLEIPGHRHLLWPPRPWDSCVPQEVCPPFRPVWLIRQARSGRWSIKAVDLEPPPHNGLPSALTPEARVWARVLTRGFDNHLDEEQQRALEAYRQVASRISRTA